MSEFVKMQKHVEGEDQPLTGEATRTAFEEVWQDLGWSLVEDAAAVPAEQQLADQGSTPGTPPPAPITPAGAQNGKHQGDSTPME
jgi:hypothetical protein